MNKRDNYITEEELYKILDACQKGRQSSQNRLYEHFFGYAMSICLRYSKTRDEAVEIVNDGFYKIFSKMDKYTQGLSFKGWLRRVMINASIDYYRRNEKHYNNVDISYARNEEIAESVISQISEKEIMRRVQELPPSYRMVFNLHAIEGFKHEEIAHELNISVGTSKSNLAVARSKLKRALVLMGRERIENHG